MHLWDVDVVIRLAETNLARSQRIAFAVSSRLIWPEELALFPEVWLALFLFSGLENN